MLVYIETNLLFLVSLAWLFLGVYHLSPWDCCGAACGLFVAWLWGAVNRKGS